MGRRIDLLGKLFEKLLVVALDPVRNYKGGCVWVCNCECGNTIKVSGEGLQNKAFISCGCLIKPPNIKHGMSRTKIYSVWRAMVQRCTNPNASRYYDYGGRGITTCEKWLTFDGFIEDMGDSYSEGLSIDRIDNNQGYYLSNCRWTDMSEQSFNQRIRKTNTSGRTGVSYIPKRKSWAAYIDKNYKRIPLGQFKTLEEAISAREAAEITYFGRIKQKGDVDGQ